MDVLSSSDRERESPPDSALGARSFDSVSVEVREDKECENLRNPL